MTRKFALLLLLAALAFTGCDKIPFLKKKKSRLLATPAPGTAATATPAPEVKPAEPPAPDINAQAAVIVLCYHRFEDRPKDSLAINPAEFEKQMQALKDLGFTVIRMQDFLAWRRGEKAIPDKSCIVTIDDGYRSGYDVAWPILKKHGFPFTMFIYTDYVRGQPRAGGQSLSWEELEAMRDAGVDIQSHTISHTNLRIKGKRTPEQYEEWLRTELAGSKKLLEQKLGISVNALAYPYGNDSPDIRRIATESGYEAAFTVYGQRIGHRSAADQLGRYAIESAKPKIFDDAMRMIGGGGGAASSGPAIAQAAAVSMVTQPMEGETISNPMPVIKANLATLGDVDPASVEMRVSGFGAVKVKYDPATKMAESQLTQKLREPSYTVILSAKSKGRKIETRWTFQYDPSARPAVEMPGDTTLPPRVTPPPAPSTKLQTPKPKK